MLSVYSFNLYGLIRILNKFFHVGCDGTEQITAIQSSRITGFNSKGTSTKAVEEAIKWFLNEHFVQSLYKVYTKFPELQKELMDMLLKGN